MNRLLVVFISGQMCLWAAIPLCAGGIGSPKGFLKDGFGESNPAFVNAASIDHAVMGSKDEKGGAGLAWISQAGMFPAVRHPFLAAFRATSGHDAFICSLLYTQTVSTRL